MPDDHRVVPTSLGLFPSKLDNHSGFGINEVRIVHPTQRDTQDNSAFYKNIVYIYRNIYIIMFNLV